MKLKDSGSLSISCIYMHIYTYIYVYIHIYIHIYKCLKNLGRFLYIEISLYIYIEILILIKEVGYYSQFNCVQMILRDVSNVKERVPLLSSFRYFFCRLLFFSFPYNLKICHNYCYVSSLQDKKTQYSAAFI